MNLAAPAGRDHSGIVKIDLDAIDDSDRSFQCRMEIKHEELVDALSRNGQQSPIILWRAPRPYLVIDGFRRVAAARELGWASLRCVLRPELSREEAFVLGYVVNAERSTFTTMERAHAVWRGIKELGLSSEQVAKTFRLSTRQIQRDLRTFSFAPEILRALDAGRISMAHAVAIHRARLPEPEPVIERIVRENLSSDELKQLLRVRRAAKRNDYLVRHSHGFRLRTIHWHKGLGPQDRDAIRDVLKRALELVEGSRQAPAKATERRAPNGEQRVIPSGASARSEETLEVLP